MNSIRKNLWCFFIIFLLHLPSCQNRVSGLRSGKERAASAENEGSQKPNIVFILADDLGWGELGCYGNTFNETPNLDKLALQGIKFTNAYAAAPVCSPTRASIMTGQYPARIGITDFLAPKTGRLLGPLNTLPSMRHLAKRVTIPV